MSTLRDLHSSEIFQLVYQDRQIDYLATMATGILRVKADTVVDEKDDRVILRGTALGGWMK